MRLVLLAMLLLAYCGWCAAMRWTGPGTTAEPGGSGQLGEPGDPPIECEWKEETLYVWIEGDEEPVKNSDIWPIRGEFMFGGCVDPGLPGNDPYGAMPYLIPW